MWARHRPGSLDTPVLDPSLIINILIAAIAANIALLALAIVVPWSRRRRPEASLAGMGGLLQAAADPRPPRPGPAPLAGVIGNGGPAPVREWAPIHPVDGPSRMSDASRRGGDGSTAADEEASMNDPLTGLLSAPAWHRVLIDEDSRIQRYRRPATVVMFELDGLERLISRLGDEAGERIIPAVADTIRREARAADHVARLGGGRFAALLPETDEIQAINYVERVRRACELWLEAGAVALRLAIGWSSANGDVSLPDAARVAGERMFSELHRGRRRGEDLTPADGGALPAEQDPGDAGEAGPATR